MAIHVTTIKGAYPLYYIYRPGTGKRKTYITYHEAMTLINRGKAHWVVA